MNVNLEVVTIPVSDVDKSLDFYRDRLGWRLDADISLGDLRIVQITPTGDGHTSIVFGEGVTTAAPGSFRHLELVTSDVVATQQEILERGIDVRDVFHGRGTVFLPEMRESGPDPERMSYNSFAVFEDPDGNSWTLQEVTTRLPGR